MRTRGLGKTALRVSEMALGTWGLSGDGYGPVDEAEQERVLHRALEMGVTLVDTADAYGGGRMERLIGKTIAGRDDVVVVTKGGTDRATLPPKKRFDAPYLRQAVERSLRRLGRDRIDVYLLHNPTENVMIAEGATGALLDLRKAGKIGHWGVSVGDVAVGRAALRMGAEVIEIAYSLMHAAELHRLAGEIMVAGAGVLARSTLAYGLLAGTWSKDREFPTGDHRADRWTKPEFERRIDQLASLQFLVRGDVRTLSAASVRFVLSNTLVSSAVLGPRSVEQLEDIVREVGMGPIYLREAELSYLPRILEATGLEV
ncbi:MAG TPA: aldo/keto reductase [Polyangiaceae bacterium]|jgi:aryl-alcohol dehydrogenase-like predicted oxidoreductase|nr:aldo/keto reductase [Polyangiaceae bacterium]